MRYTCALLVLTLTCACGGGGGSGGGGNPPTGFEQIAQQFVEDCGQEAVGELIDFLALLEPLLNPASTRPFPDYGVIAADNAGASVLWTLELNGMPPHELEGIMTFLDAQDEAAAPYDLEQELGAGLAPFPGLISSIPDGTRLESPLVGFDVALLGQGMVVRFNGGAVDGIDLLLQFQLTLCGVDFTVTGATLQSIVPAIPTLVLDLTITGQGTFATGTLTLDGTNTAVFSLTPDGATQAYDFQLDLTTGTVTPAP